MKEVETETARKDVRSKEVNTDGRGKHCKRREGSKYRKWNTMKRGRGGGNKKKEFLEKQKKKVKEKKNKNNEEENKYK